MTDNDTNVTNGTQTDANVNVNNSSDTNNVTDQNVQGAQNDTPKTNDNVDIEKLIQRAVDRATNKLGNENKKLRDQLETVKKEKLTGDEIKKLELADKEADIADREAKLAEKENRLFAIEAIKEAGLDDGGRNALDLVDFVMSNSEEVTTARVRAFSDLVKKFVTAQVNETFKSNGRKPETNGTSEGNATNNIAAKVGRLSAERDKTANTVLNHYIRR